LAGWHDVELYTVASGGRGDGFTKLAGSGVVAAAIDDLLHAGRHVVASADRPRDRSDVDVVNHQEFGLAGDSCADLTVEILAVSEGASSAVFLSVPQFVVRGAPCL
jgi:hypothetical protein